MSFYNLLFFIQFFWARWTLPFYSVFMCFHGFSIPLTNLHIKWQTLGSVETRETVRHGHLIEKTFHFLFFHFFNLLRHFLSFPFICVRFSFPFMSVHFLSFPSVTFLFRSLHFIEVIFFFMFFYFLSILFIALAIDRKHGALVASSHNRSFYRAKTWGIE